MKVHAFDRTNIANQNNISKLRCAKTGGTDRIGATATNKTVKMPRR